MYLGLSGIIALASVSFLKPLSTVALHICTLKPTCHAILPEVPAYNPNGTTSSGRSNVQRFSSQHTRCRVKTSGSLAFHGLSPPNRKSSTAKRNVTTWKSKAAGYSLEELATGEEESWRSTTIATRLRIREFRKEIEKVNDHQVYAKTMAEMGAKLYRESPDPSVLRKPPSRLTDCQSFILRDSTDTPDAQKPFFIFYTKSNPVYKLIKGCISSVYISVHLDMHGVVHVDGASDSLITKAITALILDEIEGKTLEELMTLDNLEIGNNDMIKKIGIIRRNGVKIILDHIKAEVRSQMLPSLEHKKESRTVAASSKKRVAVLLSGGVDSSVALWLLKCRGYDVEAFYLKVWGITGPEEIGNCEWEADLEHVMRICRILNVPLHVLPFQELYRSSVIEPFVQGTRCGETPNPDVFCNQYIKFGAFLDYASQWGFSQVASGHYATLEDDIVKWSESNKDPVARLDQRIKRLCIAKDRMKDQTYFLCRLGQEQLQRLMFPIGAFLKDEVRDIARTLQFQNHDRKDSMGLCFLGKVKVRSFLASFVGKQPGPIIDDDTQKQIGEHPGLYNFTIGQREGIAPYLHSVKESHKCRHVVRKEQVSNTLYVSSAYHSDKYVTTEGVRRQFKVVDIQWNVPDYRSCITDRDHKLKLKLRHSANYANGDIEFNNQETADEAKVVLHAPDVGIAPGQYAVFYQGNQCIGSGKMMAIKAN